MLGVTRATVYNLAKLGMIPSLQIKAGSGQGYAKYRFRPEWITEFIAQHTTGGKSPE